jgi:hypothetical protein
MDKYCCVKGWPTSDEQFLGYLSKWRIKTSQRRLRNSGVEDGTEFIGEVELRTNSILHYVGLVIMRSRLAGAELI